MSTVTVNISFQNELLNEIDREAKRESSSRSELLREAARLYMECQRRWEEVFRKGDALARELAITPKPLAAEIAAVRLLRRGE